VNVDEINRKQDNQATEVGKYQYVGDSGQEFTHGLRYFLSGRISVLAEPSILVRIGS